MAEPDDLLTAAEMASTFGVTVATINRWAAEGKLPVAYKLPGVRGANLFSRAAVEALALVEPRPDGQVAS